MASFEYPLKWPPGFARTDERYREQSKFKSRRETRTLKEPTVYASYQRVMAEIRSFTRVGRPLRIHHDLVVFSSNLEVLKSTGLPRSGQRSPRDPGVAVYFELDKQPYCLPCDKWLTVSGNLAAIAAHLNAIRGIERWGVGDLRAQFAGFQSLPDPNRIIWRDVFGYDAKNGPPTFIQLNSLFKELRSKHHPDKGGNAQEFDRVMKAYVMACEELGYDT